MRARGLARGVRYHRGFSLVELMVALTIGLVMATAFFAAYLGASTAGQTADAQSRMNDDAQAALLILTQQLKMAGNNPDQANRVDNDDPSLSSRHNPLYGATTFPTGTFTTSNFSIRGCNGPFNNTTSAASLDTLDCPGGATTLPDAIALNYEADSFNTISNVQASGKLPTDCLGKNLIPITAVLPTVVGAGTLSATVTYALADNRFYIGTSAAQGTPSLYCKGNGDGSTPQPLVENVEDMQLSYGAVSTSTPTAGATVAGYLRADELIALTGVANSPMPWSKVLSVRVCVLVRSEAQLASSLAAARYLNCEGLLELNPPDRRLRQAYFATVVLRNRRL